MHNNAHNGRQHDAGQENREGRIETVAGHDVVRPDSVGGVDLTAARRRETQRVNPVEDVLNRRTNVAYHVAPNNGADDRADVGVLVTITQVSKADSWTDTCIRGSARDLNTADDVTVEAYVSPLEQHTSLPTHGTYDAEADPHAERVTGPATAILPDERLLQDSLDPDEHERHDLLPEDATWFRLN